jgi:competence protein ComEA
MKLRNSLIAGLVAGLLTPMLAFAGPVNVNTADAETIAAELQGVGLSRAKAIVEYRKANGPFKTADDLIVVKGIGEKTLELNRANILVDDAGQRAKQETVSRSCAGALRHS